MAASLRPGSTASRAAASEVFLFAKGIAPSEEEAF